MASLTTTPSHPAEIYGGSAEGGATRSLICIEFFAGIGLTQLGLRANTWECVYANDIDPKKKAMYKSCFGNADHYHLEDVWETDKIISRIPERQADLATASFPCVDLSLAGNMRGLSGGESGAFYGLIRVLKKLRELRRMPRAVLVENVLGFVTSRRGEHFQTALQQLAELGYYLDAFVLDAKHFTPQSRPRVFLVGFRKELVPAGRTNETGLAWSSQGTQSSLRPVKLLKLLRSAKLSTGWVPLHLPPLPPENRRLRNYIDLDEQEDWWDKTKVQKHLVEMHSYHRIRVEALKSASDYTIGTIYRRVRSGKSKSEIRMDGLAGCLRTPRGGSSKQIVLAVGRNRIRMRWMRPREYARLQGCPDFPIEVERNEALWGFGDAVCVPAIEWIDKNVLSQLFGTKGAQPQKATPN